MHKKIVHSFLITFLITFILGFGLLYVSLYKASISQDRQYLMNTVKLVKNLEKKLEQEDIYLDHVHLL